MKIEFGAGETPTKKDFLQQDIRDVKGIDFVCAAWDIDKHVPHSSVEEIFSRHFFEHLTFAQGEKQLEVWHKILKPGGMCEMYLPNMRFHINQWVNLSDDPKQLRHAKAGFWGWQRGNFDDVWDVHKSGYNEEHLHELIASKNFVNIQSLKSQKSKELHFKFFKK